MEDEKIVENWKRELKGWYNSSFESFSTQQISKIELSFDIPFGLPFSSGKTTINHDNQKVLLEVEVKQKPQVPIKKDEKIPVPKMSLSPSMRLWNDRFGRYNFTSLKFIYEIRPTQPILELPEDIFVKKSISITNRLLDSCRMISEKYVPRNLIKSDIDSKTITYFDSANRAIHETGGSVSGGKYISNELFSDEQLKKMDTILKLNTVLTVDQELVLNAKDYLLFENYRIAVIEIQIAVEKVISRILHIHLSKIGKTETEIDKVLKKELSKLTTELQKISPTITNDPRWGRWKSDCYKIRNAVIHRNYNPTKNEADKAVKAGLEITDFLNSFR